jgi:hypothetical protein
VLLLGHDGDIMELRWCIIAFLVDHLVNLPQITDTQMTRVDHHLDGWPWEGSAILPSDDLRYSNGYYIFSFQFETNEFSDLIKIGKNMFFPL